MAADPLSSALVECIRRRFAYDEQRASDGSPPSLNRPPADGVSSNAGGGGPLWKQWEAAWAPPPITSSLDAQDRAACPFLAVVAATAAPASTGDAGSRKSNAALLASAIDDACEASTHVKSRWLDARLVIYAHAADQDPLVDADVAEGLRREREEEAGAHDDDGSIGGSARVDPALLYFATQLFDLATRWAAAHPAFVGSLHHTATDKPSAAAAARRDTAINPAMLLPHNQDTPPAATQSPPLPPSTATVEPLPLATEDNNEATGGDYSSGRWCAAPLVHTMAVTGTGLPLPIGTYLAPETVAEAEARQQREREEATSAASMAPAAFEPIDADAAADLAKMIRITAAVFDAPVATTATQVTTQHGVVDSGGIVARGITLPREQSLKMATGRAVEGRKRQRLLAATNAAGGEAIVGISRATAPEASPMPRPPPIVGAVEPSATAAGPATATAEAAQGSAALQRPAPSSSVALHRPNPFDGDYPRNPRVPRLWFVPNDSGPLVGITMSAETFGNTADDVFGIPDAPALTVLRPASPEARDAGADDDGWMRPVRLIRWVTPSAVVAPS